jgi:C4-type Zn-finger protein
MENINDMKCPECGEEKVKLLKTEQKEVKGKKVVQYNFVCKSCEHKWQHQT